MMRRIYTLLFLLLFTAPAFAVGSVIAVTVIGLTAGSFAAVATAFAINMVVSAVITKAFFSPNQSSGTSGDAAGTAPNPGNRQQVPPATDNKLPVVYGSAYIGGTIVDLSITQDNQNLYYVLALCENTRSNNSEIPDTINFGNIYYGGKKVLFKPDGYTVDGLLDESTGVIDIFVGERIFIYLYRNGSNSPVNSDQSAISVMNSAGLIYKWDNTKLMSNCAFAIIKLVYSQNANVRGIEQTKFQVINNRTNTGDCIYDYLVNTRYGAAIPPNLIDTASLAALNDYSNENFTYTTYNGVTTTQPRFRFNGALSTNRTIMQNLQDMANSCDCLVKYNEITGKWGVIVQKPTYDIAMDINDSNMISAISISPMDIAASYNVVECKFPDKSNQDAFNSSTFDLAQIAPQLLYPNEPVNKLSMSLPLVNNDVTAQYIANRILKATREDLAIQVDINYIGLELEAGDVVTVTSANYGWTAKLFRINKVIQNFADDGAIHVKLTMAEFNPAIYDDVPITQFQPAPNTGIGDPLFFGFIPAPDLLGSFPFAAVPNIQISLTTPAQGIVQYAEVWYSAFQYPTAEQRFFGGTTTVQSSGNPFPASTVMPPVTIEGLPAGTYYFFARMVNSLGTSGFSLASGAVNWKPQTYQYVERYLAVAYADDASGGGFSLNQLNKTYFGLVNVTSANAPLTPSSYTWYEALPESFGDSNYVCYAARGSRRVSLAIDNAVYVGIGGAFVPTETSIYDSTLWSAVEDGTNIIDLDMRSGQLTRIGTSSVSSADGLLSVTNNTQGTMVVSLQKFLNFGNGVYSKNFTPASLTIDVYGRVVGFTQEDDFFFTDSVVTATAGQTSFSITHLVGQVLVYRNGVLLSLDEYTETTTTVVLNNACAAGELIHFINMRAVSTDEFYADTGMFVESTSTNTFVYANLPYEEIDIGDVLAFANTGTPTTYTVTGVNVTTKTITVSATITGVLAGATVYFYRAAGSNYAPYSRITIDLTATSSYTPVDFYIRSGYEQIYINGVQLNEVDYDLSDNTLAGFPAPITGKLELILFAPNNLNVPCSNITNSVTYSVANSYSYSFINNPLSIELFANGALLAQGSAYDYEATSAGYNLVTPFTNNFTLINQQTYARLGAA